VKKCVFISLAITLAALGVILAWQARNDPARPIYRGRPLSSWMQTAIAEEDPGAGTVLELAIPLEDAASKARIGEELRSCVVHALKTKDNRCWRPYNVVRTNMPPFLAKWFPQWREAKKVRRSAASWVCARAGSFETPGTVLAEYARNDPAQRIRRMVSWAVGSYGLVTARDSQLMLPALADPNPHIRSAAVKWFSMTKISPETVVPVLVAGLEDDAMRSDYAAALRAYGPQAKFVVPSLVELSRAPRRDTASVATWALVSIDPEGAGKHFREEGMR